MGLDVKRRLSILAKVRKCSSWWFSGWYASKRHQLSRVAFLCNCHKQPCAQSVSTEGMRGGEFGKEIHINNQNNSDAIYLFS